MGQGEMDTIFSVQPDHLSSLDPAQGVLLLRSLLWAEASKAGLPLHRVVISLSESAKDGGIDAKVEKVEGAPWSTGLLTKGDSFYQIKTGTTFKPWRPSDLRKELFGRSNAKSSRARLGEAVLSCLQRRGRYVLVTLGHDLLPQQHSKAVDGLSALLSDSGFPNARVEVLGIGQLIGVLQSFPSLSLEVTGRSSPIFHTVSAWKRRADMQGGLHLAAPQQSFIEQFRAGLRKEEYQHCRVIGEPGLGKTRLVLEAVSAEDIAPATLYVPTGEDLQNSGFFNELLDPERGYAVTLIVDDCDEQDRVSIWSALKGREHLKLVTIDHGPETSADREMQVFQLPPLPNEQIEAILSDHIGKRHDLHQWAEWCSGSPRVAHAVGENLREIPEDILKPPATVAIWERFVLGHKKRDARSSEQLLCVLSHLALFERFGFELPVQSEAEFIWRLVFEADPSITRSVFQRIVRRQREHRILQGRHTLFFVPKALHVYLWLEFWKDHGIGLDVESLLKTLPRGLVNGFMRQFVYAHASPVASKAVKVVLSPSDGLFHNRDFLESEQGARFINHLAEADPGATLRLLEATVGRWEPEKLRNWQTGRQHVVWALERIAVWGEFFTRAVELLARLALAENAPQSGGSLRVLKSLFAVGFEWAATQATPSERFPFLAQLVRSDDPARRALGLELCEIWLSTRPALRVIGVEYQGLRPTIPFWRPATYDEWYDEWRRGWRFLRDEVERWPAADKAAGVQVLVNVALGLLQISDLSGEVLDTLFRLADDPRIHRKELIQFVIFAMRVKGSRATQAVAERLAELDRKLTGSSFSERLARHVLFTTWMEDHALDGQDGPASKGTNDEVTRLVDEIRSSKRLLRENAPLLLTSVSHKLHEFGFRLGKGRKKAVMEEEILHVVDETAAEANGMFLSGYLAGVREVDPDRADQLQLHLLARPETLRIGCECAWRNGPTVPILRKLLRLHKQGQIPPGAFSRVGFTARKFGLSKSLINQVIRELIARGSREASEVCIEVLDQYYTEQPSERMPQRLIFEALSLPDFFNSNNHAIDFYWYRVANRFLEEYPKRAMDLFALIISRLRDEPWLRFSRDPVGLADGIARNHPSEAWMVVSQALTQGERYSFSLAYWLGDHGSEDRPEPGAIRLFEPGKVMDWIRRDPERRLSFAARFMPKTLSAAEGGRLTQSFIDEFGDDEDLASSLFDHFWAGGWNGHRSEYLSRLRDSARSWFPEISSHRVRSWLNRYIEYLGSMIEDARIEEERER